MKTVIVLDNPSFGEKNYFVIREVNRLVSTANHCISLCPINLSPSVIESKSAVINPSDLDSFKHGVMIALDTNTAREILNTHTNAIRVLYLWELDWIGTQFNYRDLLDVIANEKLIIFTRTLDQQRVLHNLCSKHAEVIPEFNLEKIWNSLNDIKTK